MSFFNLAVHSHGRAEETRALGLVSIAHPADRPKPLAALALMPSGARTPSWNTACGCG
jgi:hypothetical protein